MVGAAKDTAAIPAATGVGGTRKCSGGRRCHAPTWHYSPARARSTRVTEERCFSLARGAAKSSPVSARISARCPTRIAAPIGHHQAGRRRMVVRGGLTLAHCCSTLIQANGIARRHGGDNPRHVASVEHGRREARLRDAGAASGRLPHLLRARGAAALSGSDRDPSRGRRTRHRGERLATRRAGERQRGHGHDHAAWYSHRCPASALAGSRIYAAVDG
jgi:hypothetical protein